MLRALAASWLLAALLTLLFPPMALRAQCGMQWQSGGGYAGLDQPPLASMYWDPDGAGPAAAQLVVAGNFSVAGDQHAPGIAAYDFGTASWSRFGTGIFGAVQSLGTLQNGELVAGGFFSFAGGVAANAIARWNGSTWAPLGGGLNGSARAMLQLANGDLVVAGGFTTAGGQSVGRVARWNGSTWSPLGAGFNNDVYTLALLPNGDLVAGGVFTVADGQTALRVARWNGVSWSPMWLGLNAQVEVLQIVPSGDLVAAGPFTASGAVPTNGIARWNGTDWQPMGSGLNGVRGLDVRANGDLVAASDLGLHRWTGTTWSPLLTGVPFRHVRGVADGDLILGGAFRSIAGVHAESIVRWDGSTFTRLAAGLDEAVLAIAPLPDGGAILGGLFQYPGAASGVAVAHWDGHTTSPLGADFAGPVHALTRLPNGDVVAGGSFATVGGVAVANITRWNGVSWSPLGSGTNGEVKALLALPNGELIAGGTFTTAGGVPVNQIARWNGATWAAMGTGVQNSGPAAVNALALLPNGHVAVGGSFLAAGPHVAGHVAVWDGSTWLPPLGVGVVGEVHALTVSPNGDLVVGGLFFLAGGAPARHVARWNGTSWTAVGTSLNNVVRGLAALPSGGLVATGDFWPYVSHWNGTTWSFIGSLSRPGRALTLRTGGELAVGGYFVTAGDVATTGAVSGAFIASLATTCPAVANVQGAGCASSGGSNLLTATTLPWVETTFRATGTGLPSLALVLAVTSVTPVVPAFALFPTFPEAIPGCNLHVAPDILELLVTTTGTAQSQLYLPDVPPLVGVVFHHQMIPIEVDAQGSILAITATNSLQLTAGRF